MAIGNAWNAGILAAQILGAGDESILDRIRDYKEEMRKLVLKG
jgi:5-(carboxyamino)imidazole ribonucleotide mutase